MDNQIKESFVKYVASFYLDDRRSFYLLKGAKLSDIESACRVLQSLVGPNVLLGTSTDRERVRKILEQEGFNEYSYPNTLANQFMDMLSDDEQRAEFIKEMRINIRHEMAGGSTDDLECFPVEMQNLTNLIMEEG